VTRPNIVKIIGMQSKDPKIYQECSWKMPYQHKENTYIGYFYTDKARSQSNRALLFPVGGNLISWKSHEM